MNINCYLVSGGKSGRDILIQESILLDRSLCSAGWVIKFFVQLYILNVYII